MTVPDSDSDPRVQKLLLAIKKGDVFVSKLESKGVDTSSIREKLSSAKNELDGGHLSNAYTLVQEYISEMNKIKERTKKSDDESKTRRGDGENRVKARRGKGVYALIRDGSNEDQMVAQWRELTSNWRDQGFQFEPEGKLFVHSFDEIEKRIISLQNQVDKANDLLDRIANIRSDYDHIGKAYKKKLDDIERSIFKLERLGDVVKRIDSVERTFQSVDERFKNFRNRINRYKRNNLNTASIEEIVENDEDLDYLKKQFEIYDGNIEFLAKEKRKLEDIKSNPISSEFSGEIEEIQKIIDDPWKLDSIVEKTLSLEKSMKDMDDKTRKRKGEEKRRREIREGLEKYRSQGYKVDMVEQVMDEDMNLLEEEYDHLMRNIAKMKSLKEKLFTLNATGFEDDVARISEKVKDPSNVVSVEKELDELKDRILNRRVKSQKIESSIKRWAGMGFSVSKLERALKDDIDESEDLFEDYMERIEELSDIEEKIKNIKHREVADQVHKLLLKVKNPELIEQIRREYENLTKKVEELEKIKEKRKDLNGLLKEWKNQGYEIEKILKKMKEESTIEGIENIILQYTRSIASLKSIKAEFKNEERGWFPTEEEFIRNNLNNLEMTMEVVKTFERLKENNQREERIRGKISRKLDSLKKKGINTFKVEKLMAGESSALHEEYERFIELTKRLLKFKTHLLKKSYKTKDKETQRIAKSINDPYMIDEYERKVKKGEKIEPTKPTEAVQEKTEEDQLDIETLKNMAMKAYKKNRLLESLGLFEAILSKKRDDKESQFYRKKVLLKLKKEKNGNGSNGKSEEAGEVPDEPPEEPTGGGSEPPEKKESAKGSNKGCISCGGTGECSWCEGAGKCSTCGGTGKYFGDTCSTCNGSGKCSVCNGTGRCSWCNR